MSGAVLLTSLVGIALLHLPALAHRWLWLGTSVAWTLFATLWLALDVRRIVRLDPGERAQVKKAILYPFEVLGVVTVALQVMNAVVWLEAWPVFLAFAVASTFALQQFVLLVYTGFRQV